MRILDVLFSIFGLLFFFPILILIYFFILFENGSPIFFQKRVGRHKKPFMLVKFRTMRVGTESVASHLVDVNSITKVGSFLRRSKLDEIPQLWNVLKGEMSLVGPRPGLFNQHELLEARQALGVYKSRPGITGLAQVSGIDMSTPQLLAETDAKMLADLTVSSYFKYILQTLQGGGRGDAVGR